MEEKLSDIIKDIRSDNSIYSFDEATTKQAIIVRILSAMSWNPFDANEVTPEYFVKGKRVDFSLRINSSNKVFLEVKKVSEDLENHQKQLLNYSFEEGVKLAVLTNGISWWFYLPLLEGNWEQRKFYAINIKQQEPSDIVKKFIDFLGKENVKNEEAVSKAEQIYKGQKKKVAIERHLPKAWNKLISEPDDFLVDLLNETLEKICGYRANESQIESFLLSNVESIDRTTRTDTVSKKTTTAKNYTQSQTTKPRKQALLPEGTLCRFAYKKNNFNGEIKNGQLTVEDYGTFSSLSTASSKISKTSRNGWRDWELKLPGSDHWILADTWRKDI